MHKGKHLCLDGLAGRGAEPHGRPDCTDGVQRLGMKREAADYACRYALGLRRRARASADRWQTRIVTICYSLLHWTE